MSEPEVNRTGGGFIDEYALQYQILIYYCLGYVGFSLLIYLWWRFYPLMEDERTPFADLMGAMFSVFLLVGDYLTDGLVMLVLITGQTALSDDTGLDPFANISLESFTLICIVISGSFVVISTGILTYIGKHNEGLSYASLPLRFVFFATGLYPLYLLVEMVSVRIFGESRATLEDIVVLKFYHARYEGIPQIALVLFLALSGVQDIDQGFLFVSLTFSVTTFVSSMVMHDYLRDVGKDTYDMENDYNYLFYNEEINNKNNTYAKREWIVKSVITRFLETFGRVSFYAIFALCTAGWGVLIIVGAEMIGLFYYHGYFFVFNVFWECINNLSDQGNVYIAWGEWKVKLVSTTIGYIIIGGIVGNNPELVATEIPQNFFIFVLGIASNVILFPWIWLLFREQRLRGYDENAEGQERIKNFDDSDIMGW